MNQFLKFYRRPIILILMSAVAFPFLWILKPFWITLVLGLVFAVSLSPGLDLINKALKGRLGLSLFLLLTGLLLLFVIPFGITLIKGTKALRETISKYNNPESLSALKQYQSDFFSRLKSLEEYGFDTEIVNEQIWTLLEKAGGFITQILSDAISQLPQMVLLFFVLWLSVISFLLMRQSFEAALSRTDWISETARRRLLDTFVSCCRSVVLSSFITGFAQALLTAVGAVIFTDQQFLMIFFVTFLLSFIPVIGAGPVSLILGLIEISQSNWGSGIALFIICGVASVLDNILRPILLSGKTQIPSIWALFCTIGAILMFGLPGLFVGPLIGALAFEMIPILAEEY
ncbi:MAG: AI-2E family transporter [Bdellovibrionales bacterium]